MALVARLDHWLQRFAKSLEDRDSDEFAALFAEDGLYYETPFDAPFRGRAAIRESVVRFATSRTNVRFEYEVLCRDGGRSMVWWRLASVAIATRAEVVVDGIFIVSFDQYDRCTLYREWWHKRERAAT